MKKIVLRIVLILLILLWMYIVFGFSASDGDSSSSLSKRIASFFTNNQETLQVLEPIIRKLAHLSEYACGGFLIFGLFLTFNLDMRKRIIFSGTWRSFICNYR